MSRQIAVIGLGLIGGSIAMGLKEFEDFKRVGVDVSQPTLRYALEQGIVDQVCEDPREALAQADLVFLCMHPRGIQEFLSCLLYTSPSPRDPKTSRMPSSA